MPPSADTIQLTPGTIVGRYRVEALLGVGGTAEVWRVRHLQLGTPHALKRLLRSHAIPMRERLLAEGRAQSRLQHDNILPVRDILDVGGHPALLLPLIEGPPLDRLLAAHRPSRDAAVALLAAITRGLSVVHDAGLVHRDLKPANVMLDLRAGVVQPRVGDFGIARDADNRRTVGGIGMGTPRYAAPEQLRDAAGVDHRADFYSLGVVLVELLTGGCEPVVDGLSTGPLRDLAARLLQRDPAARPADCATILASLPPVAGNPLGPGSAMLAAAWAHRSEPVPTVRPSSPSRPTLTLPGPNNLPTRRSIFFGRSEELRVLPERLEQTRLLTLVGLGGVGKTRLALALARQEIRAWPGGVWLCDLAEAHSAVDIAAALSEALSIPLGKGEPIAALCTGLQLRTDTLVILDNVEQVAPLALQTVGRLLRKTRTITFLATSRVPLRLTEESVFPVEPLTTADAAALLIARLSAVRSGFAVTDDNRETIDALVALLDGLPLAIELAAARGRLYGPRQLLARLSQRFRLLRSRSPDVPARQKTLRAALSWSWDLLTDTERAALAQCSVFEGGFTIEAAEAVLLLPEEDGLPPWTEDVLTALVDHGMLHRAAPGRLGMLVSVQELVAESLSLAERTAAEDRHLGFYAEFGSDDEIAALSAWGGGERLERLLTERGNLRVACQRAVVSGAVAHGLYCVRALQALTTWVGPRDQGVVQLAVVLDALLMSDDDRVSVLLDQVENLLMLARYTDARRHLDEAIALRPEDPEVQRIRGLLLRREGKMEASLAAFDGALQRHRSAGRAAGIVRTLLGAAASHRMLMQYTEGVAALSEALSISRAQGSRRLEGRALLQLAIFYDEHGHKRTAIAHYKASLVIFHSMHMRYLEGVALYNLGGLYFYQGQPTLAGEYIQRAADLHRAQGNTRGLVICRMALGEIFDTLGREDKALAHLHSGIADGEGMRHHDLCGLGWTALGGLHRRAGRLDEAEAALQAALDDFARGRNSLDVVAAHGELLLLRLAQGDPDGAAAQRVAVQGSGAPESFQGRVFVEGISGLIALHQGDFTGARAALSRAESHLREAEQYHLLIRLLLLRAEAGLDAGECRSRIAALLAEGVEATPPIQARMAR